MALYGWFASDLFGLWSSVGIMQLICSTTDSTKIEVVDAGAGSYIKDCVVYFIFSNC